jgi:two-component system, OmpR family, sensor kinase
LRNHAQQRIIQPLVLVATGTDFWTNPRAGAGRGLPYRHLALPAGTRMSLDTTGLSQGATGRTAALPRTAAPAERATVVGIPGSARARIVLSLVILLTVITVIAIVGVQQALMIRVSDQAHDALEQEVTELDRLLVGGIDPATSRRFASLEAVFDVYLRRNVPSNDEALLTFINGEPYRSSAVRFPLDRLPAERLADWEALSGGVLGEGVGASGQYDTQLGTGYFRATRVRVGEDSGAFVVTILPAEDLGEIQELMRYGLIGAILLLGLVSAGAWLITGRVLAPVRALTEAARSISRSDLTRRIPVRGHDEAAEMGRAFNTMLDRLEGVFRSQREFVANTSHELRDPLTICSGHLELLSDDPEERAASIRLVMDELDRMGRIVDDLQVLADAEQPDFLLSTPIQLTTFTHELAAKAAALADRAWTLDASADGTIVGDRHRLTEAVMNLAHNAVQHTQPGDTIAIGTSLIGGAFRLWVRDTGSGIAAADQGRIFDRFARGKGAHRRYRGSGLGLAIVKSIAEAHGGHVELDSTPGQGATFTVVLPGQRQD